MTSQNSKLIQYFTISLSSDGKGNIDDYGNTKKNIPETIINHIQQKYFAARGGSQNEPVVIGRTIGDFYSIISTIVREQDKDLYLYFYLFDVHLNNKYKNLCNLAAWLGELDSIPVWGDSLQSYEIPDVFEHIDSSLISNNSPKIEVLNETFHNSFKKINSRIYRPKSSDQNINSVAWAFNVTSLEKPEEFQYICTANPQSYASISAQLQASRFSLDIHEFSTGIHADGNYHNWISQGFSATYMNATIDPIPTIVEIAIANGLFQTVGGHPHQPAIIGRVLQGGNEQWSVVAVVTIGKDDKGRSLSAFRYFLAEGVKSISAIVTWIESEKNQGKLPIFNPFEKRQLGGANKVKIEIPEPMKLEQVDLNWLSESSSSVTKATSQLSLQDINDLAYAKSQLNNKPISWAYNIYSLKMPDRFQVIHPVNDASRNTINTVLSGNQQQPKALPASDVRLDPKVLLKNLIGQSIPSNDLIEDLLDQILEQPTFGDVTAKSYWEEVFQSFDAVIILNNRLYSPQNVRLLTWRAIVFPETLPEFVNWICDGDVNQISKNQSTFEELDGELGRYSDHIKENLILGVIELLIDLFTQRKDIDKDGIANPNSVANDAWLLGTNKVNRSPSLWSSLKDEVITAILEKVLVSATSRTGSVQAWQDFIQPLLPANATVKRSNLEQPVGCRDFYVGIRDYTINKQNNPKYVYIAELFEQLGSGQGKNFWSRAKDFISGVSQLLIFIIAIILVTIFDVSFATNIPKESWLVSMFAPLAGLASVSLITRSFISAWLVGVPHIIFIRWRLCLNNIPHGFVTAVLWTILILLIWLIYETVQSLKKSKAVNRDAYALAAVFYTISYGTVSQNVFDNAVKSGYTSNRKVQGFSIARAKTIDDSLIRFVKKMQLKGVVLFLAFVAFIFTLVLGTHTFLGANKWNSPFASILSDNPNCSNEAQAESRNDVAKGDWETTRKEIKSIADENILQGNNKALVHDALLDVLGSEELGRSLPPRYKYSYEATIDNAQQNPIIIQRWNDIISRYQIDKKKDFSEIIPNGYISRGDRTSILIRQDLKLLLEGRAKFGATRSEIKNLVNDKANTLGKDKANVIQELINVLDSKNKLSYTEKADLQYNQVIEVEANDQALKDRWIRLIYNYESRLLADPTKATGYITSTGNTIKSLSLALETSFKGSSVSIPSKLNNSGVSFTNDIKESQILDMIDEVERIAYGNTPDTKSREATLIAFREELGFSDLRYPLKDDRKSIDQSEIAKWKTSIKNHFENISRTGTQNAPEATLPILTQKVTERAKRILRR